MESQHSVRVQLMQKLQTQLDDIEKCAEEAVQADAKAATPGGGQALSSVAEKQRLIIEELRKRFHFQFGDNLEGVR